MGFALWKLCHWPLRYSRKTVNAIDRDCLIDFVAGIAFTFSSITKMQAKLGLIYVLIKNLNCRIYRQLPACAIAQHVFRTLFVTMDGQITC